MNQDMLPLDVNGQTGGVGLSGRGKGCIGIGPKIFLSQGNNSVFNTKVVICSN